jgi:hypothetical protein
MKPQNVLIGADSIVKVRVVHGVGACACSVRSGVCVCVCVCAVCCVAVRSGVCASSRCHPPRVHPSFATLPYSPPSLLLSLSPPFLLFTLLLPA